MFRPVFTRPGTFRSLFAAPAAVTLTVVLLLGGCAGRTEVSRGPGPARNLPEKPHYTPQQYPAPSTLQAVQEPTPGAQE